MIPLQVLKFSDEDLLRARWAMALPFSASLATEALMGKELQRAVAKLFVLLPGWRGGLRILQ